MADPSDPTTDPTDWAAIGEAIAEGWLRRVGNGSVQKGMVSTLTEAGGAVKAVAWEIVLDTAVKAGKLLRDLEEPAMPLIASFVAPSVAGLFNAEVNEGDFTRKLVSGGGQAPARSIVDGFLKAVQGDGGDCAIEPSEDGAKRLATAAVQASLEAVFNAIVPEMLSDFLPEIGHFKELTELPESIIRTLGVSRLVRTALRPYVAATCATPLTLGSRKRA